MSNTSPLSWTLRSIARLERATGVREPRLTEPNLAKWNRFRRRLGWVDFIALLHEDLAEAFPEPFDLRRWGTDPLADLSEEDAAALVQQAVVEDTSDGQNFLRRAAMGMGLPPNGNIASLPRVQPHQRALELPGAGGRIAAQQVLQSQGSLAFDQQFRFVATTLEERVSVGLAAVELRANPPTILSAQQALSQKRELDRALGVKGHAGAQALATELALEVGWS